MNIDRPSSTPQAVTGAVARASSKAQHDAPEFSFDTGETPHAPVESRREMPREQVAQNETRPHEATRPRRDDASRGDESTQAANAKPHERANAAARRDGKPQDNASADDANATTSTTASDASDDTATKATRDDAPATASTPDSLPDRMLALLTGDWAATAKPAPVAPTDAATTALTGTLPGATALPSTALPTALATAPLAGAVTTATDATASATPNASPPTGAAGIALLQALSPGAGATNAQPAAATPAADAFAALAAMAESKTDRTGAASSIDGSTTTAPAIAFNPLMTRGMDVPSTVRDVVAASPLAAPLSLDADFDDGMSQRITWMADQKLEHAEIRVTPEALGPIDIRLQMDGHRVNAQFHAAHADVRRALESGMDQLRDLLGRQGMELGNAQVGSGGRQPGDGRSTAASGAFPGAGELGADAEQQVTTVRVLRSRGIIDEYA
ncbi:flagellar hook-length control protein FliK [Lysobacter claricitrinus]|uniref:flagellar hook-length control protein FliK n=1 Tax=Lysobacter claricitrinus TaxID=3367728 RepID=UPI0037DBB7D2